MGVLFFRRKSKKLIVQIQDSTQVPQTTPEQGNKARSFGPQLAGKECVFIRKDLEKILRSSIEVPLSAIVRTASIEILTPLTKVLRNAWGKEAGDFLGPLATVVVHPRELLGTININDTTASVTEVLKALIRKSTDEVLVPFLDVLRSVLETLPGGKNVFILVYLENLVSDIVPVILKAIFGCQTGTDTEVWIASITGDLLKALQGPSKATLSKGGKFSPANTTGNISVAAKTQANIVSPLQFSAPSKLVAPVEESLADSLKETLEDFKTQVDQALS